MISSAFINIWEQRIGAIAWNADTGLASFEYEPSFLNKGWDLAPIKMPIANARNRIFSFPELRNTQTFKGLPGLLADILPDRYGSTLINAWLARHGRPANSMNPVELLCFIGKRGMGALEFEPVVPQSGNTATKIELEGLIQIAREILSGKQSFQRDLSKDESKALSDILRIGSSAGGARAKAVVAFNPETQEIRSGQANAPKGFSHWLLKFDGIQDAELGSSNGYGRIEMAYHLMAKDAGIHMTECRLLEEQGRAHFMTKRFDRSGDEKKHVQSFCAMNHYDFNNIGIFSYEQLFETMRRLLLPYSDAEQLFRRMTFNVMARNCDDHTKNFSFMMDQSGVWQLSPAFDICHSYRPDSTWVSQHSLSINGKRKDISRNDILAVAKSMHIKKANTIIDQVHEAVRKWNEFAAETKVDPILREAVWKTLLFL
jgi:serine/threonine-protein kinase HipA